MDVGFVGLVIGGLEREFGLVIVIVFYFNFLRFF